MKQYHVDIASDTLLYTIVYIPKVRMAFKRKWEYLDGTPNDMHMVLHALLKYA